MVFPISWLHPTTDANLRAFSIAEITIRRLAELVVELVGSRSKLEYLPLPNDDPKQRQPDISLAQRQLGWQPTTELRDGLTRTIRYFDDLLARSR